MLLSFLFFIRQNNRIYVANTSSYLCGHCRSTRKLVHGADRARKCTPETQFVIHWYHFDSTRPKLVFLCIADTYANRTFQVVNMRSSCHFVPNPIRVRPHVLFPPKSSCWSTRAWLDSSSIVNEAATRVSLFRSVPWRQIATKWAHTAFPVAVDGATMVGGLWENCLLP